MKLVALLSRVTPRKAAQLFALGNIAFLGVDIGIAHLANDYARRAEWAPLYFSAIAAVMLVPGAMDLRHRYVTLLDRLVGFGAVLLGVLGMIFHLQSSFFAVQTLHNLVYSAPFVAPASYIGVGLLILLLRSDEAETPSLGPWILALALGGFVGNFALSVLDHAQNGFFHATEWIPVASAGLAIGFLIVMLATRRSESEPLLRRCVLGVMALQMLVGVVGFGLHLSADLQAPAASLLGRIVFGSPPFAPLLFSDLAALAAIGVWASPPMRVARATTPRSGVAPLPAGYRPCEFTSVQRALPRASGR